MQNYCSPNFAHEPRQPLQDHGHNLDNIRQARSRISELQNIINELNKSQDKRTSISPIRKSPLRTVTPPLISKYTKTAEPSKKHSPRFQTPTPDVKNFTIKQSENAESLLQGLIPESLIINIDQYQQGKVLGLGSYAIVRLCSTKQCQVAIKTYEKVKLNDYQKKKNVTREIKILSKLRHPNIIKLIGVNESTSQLNLVMEFCSANSLSSFLKQKITRQLSEDEARLIFRQIVDALRYCHHKNVVHRDLKLENILIDEYQRVKVIDFGFSIAIDPATKLNVFCGTPSYMAPEIVNKQQYSFPADVWALGILLFKLTTGVFPFRGSDDKELYKKINLCKIDYPPTMSLGLKSFLSRMLKIDQYERPSLKVLYNDEWLIL